MLCFPSSYSLPFYRISPSQTSTLISSSLPFQNLRSRITDFASLPPILCSLSCFSLTNSLVTFTSPKPPPPLAPLPNTNISTSYTYFSFFNLLPPHLSFVHSSILLFLFPCINLLTSLPIPSFFEPLLFTRISSSRTIPLTSVLHYLSSYLLIILPFLLFPHLVPHLLLTIFLVPFFFPSRIFLSSHSSYLSTSVSFHLPSIILGFAHHRPSFSLFISFPSSSFPPFWFIYFSFLACPPQYSIFFPNIFSP